MDEAPVAQGGSEKPLNKKRRKGIAFSGKRVSPVLRIHEKGAPTARRK
jgi:hypothetical protein